MNPSPDIQLSGTPLETTLRSFLESIGTRDRLLIAFSGGPDSTALLWGLARLLEKRHEKLHEKLHAAHLDHRLDSDSPRRAAAARRLAAEIDVPLTVETLPDAATDRQSESLEAFARRQRYGFLSRLRENLGAHWVVTAHHADDQAETVLLRMLFGSGIEGLGAMPRTRGHLARPLLDLRRHSLTTAIADAGLRSVEDPTNRDPRTPRNFVRRNLLPVLERQDPKIVRRLCQLAERTRGANRRIERLLVALLRPYASYEPLTGKIRGAKIDRDAFESLPLPLKTFALALLHRTASAGYPAGSPARAELLRQLSRRVAVGCDCGDGWRWEADADALRVVKSASSPGEFTYTLDAPGSVEIRELGLSFRFARGPVAPWMFEGATRRAGLSGVDLGTRRLLVRNRRAGDRIQPLGSQVRRSLKDLLIDRRVPKRERDRLPLLVIDDEIAWVPGVTISEHFRLRGDTTAWIAEINHLGPKS